VSFLCHSTKGYGQFDEDAFNIGMMPATFRELVQFFIKRRNLSVEQLANWQISRAKPFTDG